MKRCAKSRPEAPCLTAYRATCPAATWAQFCAERPTCYEDLRRQLRSDQGGLCAYCESDLEPNNEQVAHFHPKSDTATTRNWALDWENLWLACKGGSQSWMQDPEHYSPPLPENLSCDEKKGATILDGEVLAPHEVPAFPRIFRFEQFPDRVEIRPDDPACENAGVPIEKAKRTIEEFGLNCPRLAAARLAVHRQLEQALKRLHETGNANVREALLLLVRRHLSQKPDGHWRRFFTLVRWRLGPAAETYLRSVNFSG